MNKERDKFLTEATGEQFHDFVSVNGSSFLRCTTCSEWSYRVSNPKFSTWEGFGKLWEWSQEQEWIFQLYLFLELNKDCAAWTQYIDPDSFANVIYEFLKEQQK